ncbi:hypothetical protein AG1IA_01922 [Rhizoctonia solani AG-1 IA]|uniref:Uncharacterized protein n=1 Tax=Thanatephorus cucumeris (strain AG1-IA) TaxID=983506 RepID=L8X4L1_THACA|nr:hypothetical protein AG1IA_01922 [Rhizoctonia solani AG-1 IA]
MICNDGPDSRLAVQPALTAHRRSPRHINEARIRASRHENVQRVASTYPRTTCVLISRAGKQLGYSAKHWSWTRISRREKKAHRTSHEQYVHGDLDKPSEKAIHNQRNSRVTSTGTKSERSRCIVASLESQAASSEPRKLMDDRRLIAHPKAKLQARLKP